MRCPEARCSLVVGVLACLCLLVSGCGGAGPRPLANAATTTSTRTETSTVAGGGHRNATPPRNRKATVLVDEWAACERSHGDPDQSDPTIDAHGVINITTPRQRLGLRSVGDAGTCSAYLAKAQRTLRAAYPVQDPNGVGDSEYLKYVTCMRANGVPDYPSPEPNDPGKTDFIGSGVDPNSPHVRKVNDLCGKKLDLPTWWINGWGPPGDISTRSAGLHQGPPACAFRKKKPCPTLAHVKPSNF
jgi:hypothetical protein